MTLLLGNTSMAAIVITFEKRSGTLNRLLLAPLSHRTIIAGYFPLLFMFTHVLNITAYSNSHLKTEMASLDHLMVIQPPIKWTGTGDVWRHAAPYSCHSGRLLLLDPDIGHRVGRIPCWQHQKIIATIVCKPSY